MYADAMVEQQVTFYADYWKTPEVRRAGRDLVDYCTSWMEAANGAGNLLAHTACGKDPQALVWFPGNFAPLPQLRDERSFVEISADSGGARFFCECTE